MNSHSLSIPPSFIFHANETTGKHDKRFYVSVEEEGDLGDIWMNVYMWCQV